MSDVCSSKLSEKSNKKKKTGNVDQKRADYSKYSKAYLIKPNLKEFVEATRIKTNTKSENFINQIKAGAKKLFDQHGIENFIVTLSEHGMLYISSKSPNEVLQIPTEARDIFYVSGAGDTSLVTLGIAIGAWPTVKAAMKLAMIG